MGRIGSLEARARVRDSATGMRRSAAPTPAVAYDSQPVFTNSGTPKPSPLTPLLREEHRTARPQNTIRILWPCDTFSLWT
jgi:hypothetical protein